MTDKYYVVYRCLTCGYESTVTNVCRSCMKNMYATGKEKSFKHRKRSIRQGTPNEEEALRWNNLQFASDKLYQRKSPFWALGIEEYRERQK